MKFGGASSLSNIVIPFLNSCLVFAYIDNLLWPETKIDLMVAELYDFRGGPKHALQLITKDVMGDTSGGFMCMSRLFMGLQASAEGFMFR